MYTNNTYYIIERHAIAVGEAQAIGWLYDCAIPSLSYEGEYPVIKAHRGTLGLTTIWSGNRWMNEQDAISQCIEDANSSDKRPTAITLAEAVEDMLAISSEDENRIAFTKNLRDFLVMQIKRAEAKSGHHSWMRGRPTCRLSGDDHLIELSNLLVGWLGYTPVEGDPFLLFDIAREH